ncbi:hypothetical protein BaRGS_00028014, partial [Batillaria attramentaria]
FSDHVCSCTCSVAGQTAALEQGKQRGVYTPPHTTSARGGMTQPSSDSRWVANWLTNPGSSH